MRDYYPIASLRKTTNGLGATRPNQVERWNLGDVLAGHPDMEDLLRAKQGVTLPPPRF